MKFFTSLILFVFISRKDKSPRHVTHDKDQYGHDFRDRL